MKASHSGEVSLEILHINAFIKDVNSKDWSPDRNAATKIGLKELQKYYFKSINLKFNERVNVLFRNLIQHFNSKTLLVDRRSPES